MQYSRYLSVLSVTVVVVVILSWVSVRAVAFGLGDNAVVLTRTTGQRWRRSYSTRTFLAEQPPQAPRWFPPRTVSTASTRLSLLPTQGNQLIAAGSCAYDNDGSDHVPMNVAISHEKEVDDVAAYNNQHQQLSRHSYFGHSYEIVKRSISVLVQSFVTTMVTLPASILGVVVGRQTSTLSSSAPFGKENDEVLYPLTGFALVRDQPNHYRVLSSVPNPSCQLHPSPVREPLYGWYSPACPIPLDDNVDG